MKESKTKVFIYYDKSSEQYFEKKITMKMDSVKTEDIYFNLFTVNFIKRFIKDLEIKREMKRLIAHNDVVLIQNNDEQKNVIVTTGGIISGKINDNFMMLFVLDDAYKKYDKRRFKIDECFYNYPYHSSREKSYEKNSENIEKLLEIHQKLLSGELDGDNNTYLELLDCLIEAPEPIKTNGYPERVKQLLKEYPSK